MESVIQVEGLVKNFGSTRALAGVDLTVRRGSVLGLLGPNGSGKTTTVRVLATLLRPDAGRASVFGHDVVAEPDAVRRRIGLTGQYAAVDEALTGTENLLLIARLLDLSRAESPVARRRARSSGSGSPRRPDGGCAPTPAACGGGSTSPRASSAAPTCCSSTSPPPGWIRGTATRSGTASATWPPTAPRSLLTTQYLEEADQLADDLVVLDRGRVIAAGTPAR